MRIGVQSCLCTSKSGVVITLTLLKTVEGRRRAAEGGEGEKLNIQLLMKE